MWNCVWENQNRPKSLEKVHFLNMIAGLSHIMSMGAAKTLSESARLNGWPINGPLSCSKFTVIHNMIHNKGADQTARMRRLVCACVVRKPPKTGFLASRPINDRRNRYRKGRFHLLATRSIERKITWVLSDVLPYKKHCERKRKPAFKGYSVQWGVSCKYTWLIHEDESGRGELGSKWFFSSKKC